MPAWQARGGWPWSRHRGTSPACRRTSVVVDSLSKWQWEILVSSLWMSCDQSWAPLQPSDFLHKFAWSPSPSLLSTLFWFRLQYINTLSIQLVCTRQPETPGKTCEHYGTNLVFLCILEYFYSCMIIHFICGTFNWCFIACQQKYYLFRNNNVRKIVKCEKEGEKEWKKFFPMLMWIFLFVLFYACFINKCFRVQLQCISFVVNLILLNMSFPTLIIDHFLTGYHILYIHKNNSHKWCFPLLLT